MGTLLEKANQILTEKESKIINTNIKNGVNIFDVTGTFNGINDTLSFHKGETMIFGFTELRYFIENLPDEIKSLKVVEGESDMAKSVILGKGYKNSNVYLNIDTTAQDVSLNVEISDAYDTTNPATLDVNVELLDCSSFSWPEPGELTVDDLVNLFQYSGHSYTYGFSEGTPTPELILPGNNNEIWINLAEEYQGSNVLHFKTIYAGNPIDVITKYSE